MDSLTLLRSNVQSYFNERINVVMKDFVKTFFEPAIKNIKDNTNETISEQQVKFLCKSLLDTCSNQQYSSPRHEQLSSPLSSLSRNNSDVNTSDSDNENGQTSLLHQALKRKRTESETEQLFKRQFFLTKTSSNYFGSPGLRTQSTTLKPTATTSIAVLSSAQKIVTRPTSGILATNGTTTTRPIIHIIPSASNKNLVATHMELATLLSNSTSDSRRNAIISTSKSPGNGNVVTSSNIVSSTTSDSTKVTSTQSESF